MTSLRAKFTAVFIVTLTIVIIFFSLAVYVFTINSAKQITQAELQSIAANTPRIRKLLERNGDLEEIKNLGDQIRQEQTQTLTRRLLILTPLTLIISAIGAYLVAGYLVKPIHAVSQNLKKIGPKNLDFRLPSSHSSQEIELLTESVNKLLDQLAGALRSQEQFIQDAAHELRSPLASIKAALQVFHENESPKLEDFKSLISILERLNDRLIRLNEKLIFLNRNMEGKLDLRTINLYDFFEDIFETLTDKASKRQVKLIMNIPAQQTIKVDAEKFALAASNLVENALKYSNGKDSQLEVRSLQQGSTIQIQFIDNGIGIPANDLPHIFDRFHRAGNAKGEGEGLGLAMVQKVVQAHSGEINVASKVAVGTTITISLPAEL
jgi:signal transduction histidine kinase